VTRLAFALAAVVALAGPAKAEDEIDRVGREVVACISAAAAVNQVSAEWLLVLLDVESGVLGRVSQNLNGTVDIGPMQVNERWLLALAGRWHASKEEVYTSLRDNFCANVEAGAWILRQAVDEARGDLWDGIALYHSHRQDEQATYLGKVLRAALSQGVLPRHLDESRADVRRTESSRAGED
jgi:soluble lytic murein transglycosylase-like protein